jgi:hypothetical protein
MSCMETKQRTDRGATITTHGCRVFSGTSPVTDLTKLADGAPVAAAPKWLNLTGKEAADLAAGKPVRPELERFAVTGTIPHGRARLAEARPAPAPDTSAAERAAELTCGGSRDTLTALDPQTLTQILNSADRDAIIAWSTPNDFALVSHLAPNLTAYGTVCGPRHEQAAPVTPPPASDIEKHVARLLEDRNHTTSTIDRVLVTPPASIYPHLLQGQPGVVRKVLDEAMTNATAALNHTRRINDDLARLNDAADHLARERGRALSHAPALQNAAQQPIRQAADRLNDERRLTHRVQQQWAQTLRSYDAAYASLQQLWRTPGEDQNLVNHNQRLLEQAFATHREAERSTRQLQTLATENLAATGALIHRR